jgi:hypothetical protein
MGEKRGGGRECDTVGEETAGQRERKRQKKQKSCYVKKAERRAPSQHIPTASESDHHHVILYCTYTHFPSIVELRSSSSPPAVQPQALEQAMSLRKSEQHARSSTWHLGTSAGGLRGFTRGKPSLPRVFKLCRLCSLNGRVYAAPNIRG